jgi:exosome complex exonuclease RRP6
MYHLIVQSQDSQTRDLTSSRFQEVLSRIHSSLVIARSAPKRVPSSMSTKEHTDPTSDEVTVTEGPELSINATFSPESGLIEIPYIPTHQRQATERVQDSIVVVGQPCQQKRKRMKNAPVNSLTAKDPQPAERAVNTKKYKTTSEDVEQGLFEFSDVPNILDDGSGSGLDLGSTKDLNIRTKTGELMSRAYSTAKGSFCH